MVHHQMSFYAKRHNESQPTVTLTVPYTWTRRLWHGDLKTNTPAQGAGWALSSTILMLISQTKVRNIEDLHVARLAYFCTWTRFGMFHPSLPLSLPTISSLHLFSAFQCACILILNEWSCKCDLGKSDEVLSHLTKNNNINFKKSSSLQLSPNFIFHLMKMTILR